MTRREDGLWQQSLSLVVNGRKVRKYFYGRTKADVLAKIREYQEAEAVGPTFGEVADEWWEQHEPTLATNTLKSYRPALKRAIEYFGTTRIREIRPADINKFVRTFIKETNAAHKTASTQLMVINLIGRYSVENGYLQSNPARDVSLPRNLPKSARLLPPEGDIARIKAAANAPFGMFAYWILYTGCRRGELLALTWEDVDCDNNSVHISKSLYYVNGKPMIKRPKTENGIRDVPLMTKLKEKLKPGKGLIFVSEKGTYISEWEFQDAWAEYIKASGVTCTPHQIRHAYATMLYENDVAPKDSQQLLGHAQLSTTMDIYTHIRAEKAQKVKDALVNLDITD